jgi:hypothetical protein
MNPYLCKLSRELLSICLNRDCLSRASGFLEFLIFLLPLSTAARGRLRAEKKKRMKSHLFQIISHGLIFYTSIPFQNAQNNFSTYKTH